MKFTICSHILNIFRQSRLHFAIFYTSDTINGRIQTSSICVGVIACPCVYICAYGCVLTMSLSDSKSPHVSKTLHSILAVLNNVVVRMVSTHPPVSKSSSPFNNPLVTVPKAPITVGIIVTFMFHSFFNSLTRSRYLSLFSHSFSFILWSSGTAKSTILQVLFFYCR